MAVKENLNSLKVLVFSLGLVLVGAIVLLAGLVWKRTADTPVITAADCQGGHVNLKGHGMMIDTGFDEKTMRVTMEKAEGQSEVMFIDICSGKVVTTLTLETDAAVVE